MSTAELKSELIKNINFTDDIIVLNKIKELLDFDEKENDVYVFTPEQQKKIDKALKQYENGECISDEEAQKEIQAWLED